MRRPLGLVWVALTLLVFLAVGSPATAEEKWGPFRGKVVDVETGKPIPGAVILMIWLKLVYAVVQTNTEFYDAREAVTGPDGTFEIPRRSPPFFTFNIIRYRPKIFAPGYAEHRWVVTPPTGETLVDPTVIEMRRLKTREERLDALRYADSGSVPAEKRCSLTKAVNLERRSLGLQSQYPECAP